MAGCPSDFVPGPVQLYVNIRYCCRVLLQCPRVVRTPGRHFHTVIAGSRVHSQSSTMQIEHSANIVISSAGVTGFRIRIPFDLDTDLAQEN